ncbi:MAG: hypothetical protein DRG11_01705 [Epsilonproteobacteria bacterium]|nr:MAG: hypothetical protein DRG11_01705 [Campylobacterota bacterium]
MILYGNINSSKTEETTATIVPISYKVLDNLVVSATMIKADIQGVDATEGNLKVEYGLGKTSKVSFAYGKFDGDDGCSINDQTNMAIALSVEF